MFPFFVLHYEHKEKQFTYWEISDRTIILRAALTINLINLLPELLIKTTLVWEAAAQFNDLLKAVFSRLKPLTIFVLYICVTFIFLFYTIGKHQMTFDFNTDYNLASMESTMVREYDDGSNDTAYEERYDTILGNVHSSEIGEVDYRGFAGSCIFVY